MNKRDTKTLLFEKGAEPIHLKGYNSTGIQEILQAAGVPKGSFYYHFKNKEDYVLQLMDYFGNFVFGWLDRILEDTDKTPINRLRTFFPNSCWIIKRNNIREAVLLAIWPRRWGISTMPLRQRPNSSSTALNHVLYGF